MTTRSPRRRSLSVSVGITAILAALSGCSVEEEYDYGAVCAERATELRDEDDLCEDGTSQYENGIYGWYYFPVDRYAGAIGERVRGGSFTPPSSGSVYRGGIPEDGADVSRKGFGGKSGSFGG